MEARPRSAEEQVEMIREVIRLSLFFAAEYHGRHREETIDSIIAARTSIWEILGLKDSDREAGFTAELGRLYAGAGSSSAFEEEGLKLLEPDMEIFIEGNLNWERKILSKYDGSCLRYDAPLESLPRNHCNFHITNSIAPRSITDEEGYTAGCFRRLMEEGRREYGYDVLRTTTWLNSAPQWLKFFPQQWQDNLSEPNEEIRGNLGYWGQIVTARKTFNRRRGEYIRRNLELPYKPRSSWCTFEAMQEHLQRFL